jgi:predicted ATPase
LNGFVVISGCSGGGKSTLLAELAARGHAVVEEPGRRIVKHELETGGSALPWSDMEAFARRLVEVARADHAAASRSGEWVFFDRGLIDAVTAFQSVTGEPAQSAPDLPGLYHRQVFLAPPWPEIYVTDPERRHGLDEALGEYERLLKVYPALGYHLTILPKLGVAERADFVLDALAS